MKRALVGVVVAAMLCGCLEVQAFYYTITGTVDNLDAAVHGGSGTQVSPYQMSSLRGAILNANTSGAGPHVINVPSGTYSLTLGELQIVTSSGNVSVTINGTGTPANTIVQQTGSGTNRVFDVDMNLLGGVNVTLQNLTIAHGRNADGIGGAGLICGFQGAAPALPDSTTVSNCVFLDNQVLGTVPGAVGGAIQNIGGTLTVSGCTFDSNSAGNFSGGAIYFDTHSPSIGALQLVGCLFTNNSSGANNSGGGALFLTAAAGSSLNVSNCTFLGNLATGSSAGGAGIYKDGAAQLTVTGCTFVSNQVQSSSATLNLSSGGAVDDNSGPITIQYCRFFGNGTVLGNKGSALYLAVNNGATANVANNWWSSNTGPGSGVFTAGSSDGAAGTWLQLRHYANPGAILVNGSTTLVATFATNSAGASIPVSNLGVLIGLPITFGPAFLGTISGAQPTIQASGTATATFTAGAAPGTGTAGATVDGAIAKATISILCPTITAVVSGGGMVCPGSSTNVTVDLTGGTPPYTVTLNNGGGTVTSTSPVVVTVNPLVTTTYSVISATDTYGCSASVTGTATVTLDNIPPTVNCPSDITVVGFGDCPVAVNFSVSASDNCTLQSVYATPPSGTAFLPGTNTVNVTASDVAGNTNTCSFKVIVQAVPASLSIAAAGTNVLLSWPSGASCFSLQFATNLVAAPNGMWTYYGGPLVTNGGSIFVTNPIGVNSRFFRLAH
jgi:hypothetical protein